MLQEEMNKKELGEESVKRKSKKVNKNQFLRQISVNMANVGKSKFSGTMSPRSRGSEDEDDLPDYQKKELATRLRNAFAMGRKNREGNKKKKMNAKERFDKNFELKKFDLEKFQKFKKTRKKLGDEFTRRIYKQGLKYEKYGVLNEIERYSKALKSPKKKKKKDIKKKFFMKALTLEAIFEEENKRRDSVNQSTMITEPKSSIISSKKEKSIISKGSNFINKVKVLNKFNFYFHPDEAKCVILSFIKEKARNLKKKENLKT